LFLEFSSPPLPVEYFLISQAIDQIKVLHLSPAPSFKTIPGKSDLLPKMAKFQHNKMLFSKVATY
jgi:hypothetical protein